MCVKKKKNQVKGAKEICQKAKLTKIKLNYGENNEFLFPDDIFLLHIFPNFMLPASVYFILK